MENSKQIHITRKKVGSPILDYKVLDKSSHLHLLLIN